MFPKNNFSEFTPGDNIPHYAQPKLTPKQRDEIRARLLDGEDARDLALEYHVSARTIRSMK